MTKFLLSNCCKFHFIAVIAFMLSACVSQEYTADNTPVITNEANNQEIAMTHIQLGLGYLKIGNTTQAKLNLEKAKQKAPHLVQVYTAFAHYYATVGETKLTIQAYEKALSIKSDDADTLNNYGVFLCDQGHVKEAKKEFLKAIAVPSYLLVSQSYENIALCELKNNFFDKAQQYLVKAIGHDPSNAAALIQMAQLQYAKNNDQKAENYINRYEKSTRHFTPGPLALAYKVYSRSGKQKEARGYASMLVKMFPHSSLAKQYILTGLAHIEADTLAVRYKNTKLKNEPRTVHQKKRVIKLSPPKEAVILNDVVNHGAIAEVKQEPIVKTKVKTKQKLSTALDILHPKSNKIDLLINKIKATKGPKISRSKFTDKITTVKLTRPEQGVNNKFFKENIPVYVVKSGDNLFLISKKYNIRMATLKRWNHLKNKSVLRVGDVILLADPMTGIAP